MIFLSNEVVVFLFIEAVLLLLMSIAFVNTLGILRRWDFGSTSSLQYKLEKRAYLVVLIILFTLSFKVLQLPFFSFTIDKLSAIVPGAMCGAGVITANEYGPLLMSLKVVILFLTGIWLILNDEDLRAKEYPYFKAKFWFFTIIFLFVVIESILDVFYLANISILSPVACCSTIYGAVGGSELPFDLDVTRLLLLFYLFYGLAVVTALYRYAFISLLSNVLFLYVSYYAVVYFFGTYVYELPTHKCPFCMLQKEYFYVGYLIWGTLFLGTFFGTAGAVLKTIMRKEVRSTYEYSVWFNTIFVLLCSLYVVVFYLRNGVFL